MPFPVEATLIDEAERQLGRTLPTDLRVRLRRDNGGGIRAAGDEWQLFPVFDPGDRKRITRTANHIVRETRSAREYAGFPANAIAIAANGGGDFLIARAGSDEVEFWDHETGETEPVEVDWDCHRPFAAD
jgi:SMI1 / KNR4 family (SUKH-1)